MSDETRTVTREDIRQAVYDATPGIIPQTEADLVESIWAALPTSTEGLEVDTLTAALWGMRFDPDARRFAQKIAAEYARLASLSPSPTEPSS